VFRPSAEIIDSVEKDGQFKIGFKVKWGKSA
jgi:hypothetical protein